MLWVLKSDHLYMANVWDFTDGIVGQGSYKSLKIFVIRIVFFRVLFVLFNYIEIFSLFL